MKKKFEVIHYYTSSKVYVVDAENEDEAADIVNGTNIEPAEATEPAFSDEIVRERDSRYGN